MLTQTRPPFDPIDISRITFWDGTHADREGSFATLRAARPVSWQPPAEGGMIETQDDGFWAVTGHPEVMHVSRHPERFSSERKGFMLDDIPLEYYRAGGSVLFHDPPEHTKLRRLVSQAFTPRHVKTIEAQIERQAKLIVDDLLRGPGEVDFMKAVAERLPMWTISEAVGVPEEQRAEVTAVALQAISMHDPEVQAGRTPEQVMVETHGWLFLKAMEIAAARRAEPRDDLMSALVQADVDGESLSDEEIGAFFLLLVVAGTDTTRNATGHAVRLLAEHPDQRELLLSDLDAHMPRAVEEILRWAAPVMTMRRTATEDVELGGQHIREGDKVVMYYAAANFDARVWPDPHRFDITREPNRHFSFGGGGPHYCLGAPLARAQLKAILTQLLTRVPELEVGVPEMELSNFICAIKRLSCGLTPRP